MLNTFSGIGNVGKTPVLQRIEIEGEKHTVAHLRVFFDRPVRQEDARYQDKGGFWLSVSLWDRRAEDAFRLLRTGSRVFIQGELRSQQWTDKDTGELRNELQLNGDRFFIDPLGVDAVQYQLRSAKDSGASAARQDSRDFNAASNAEFSDAREEDEELLKRQDAALVG